jgi:putative MFS transporter
LTRTESTLPREQRILLLLVGSSLLINNFDLYIFTLALPQIQASLGIPEDKVGLYTGLIRLGVLAAFPLAFMADVIGRRRLLLITITGCAITTVLSGFVRNSTEYFALQTMARCFAYAEDMLCFVIIAEEIDEKWRGWAFGRLMALGACGNGLAALLYTQVDALPHGWRDFYLISAVGLAGILWARQSLKETQRFETLRQHRLSVRRGLAAHLAPIGGLLHAYPGRFWAMVGTAAPMSFSLAAALAFLSKYLQETHHYSPGEVGTLMVLGGTVSLIGYFIAGRISDIVGRRTVLAVGILGSTVGLAAFYLVPGGVWLAPIWIFSIFAFFAAEVTLSALGAELFPTSYRSTASAARSVINVTAGLAGLAAESLLYGMLGSHALAIVVLIAVTPLSLIPLLLFIPETARRTLEDISPEVGPGTTTLL